jgi:four helix bundle protein
MEKIKSFKDLIVWQKGMDLTVAIYTLAANFPQEEKYNLTSQMKRAAVSIPSNIAEGSRRSTKKDFRNFIINAYGSGAELESQSELAKRLGLVTKEQCEKTDSLLNEVMKMLNSLQNKLK